MQEIVKSNKKSKDCTHDINAFWMDTLHGTWQYKEIEDYIHYTVRQEDTGIRVYEVK